MSSVVFPTLMLGACGDDTPTSETYDEIAELTSKTLVNASGGDTASLEIVASVSLSGELPRGFDGSAEAFAGDVLGVTYAYAVRCSPAACGEGTRSASVDVTWDGMLELPRFQGSFERSGSWSVSGLDRGEPTFDGKGDFEIESSFTPLLVDGESHYRLAYEADYDGLALDPETLLPAKGKVSYDLAAESLTRAGDDEAETRLEIEVVLEILAVGQARLTLDGTAAYDIDLESGDFSSVE